MPLLTLPAGQSIRDIAARLGVTVDALQEHSGVQDVEAPLDLEQRVEVPDGFLRSRTQRDQLRDAVTTESGKRAGMNMWLALDIEQKRTRAGGGMKAHEMTASEEEALAEARRAYLRFEADSNELAIELFEQTTATHSIETRAKGFSGMALALAQRHHLFGESVDRSRQHALSSAKAALLADPKLVEAHLAMALAVRIDADDTARSEAYDELERAVSLDPSAGCCWAEVASIALSEADLDGAEAAAQRAIESAPDWIFSLETTGDLAAWRGDLFEAKRLYKEGIVSVPTYANIVARLARAERLNGELEQGKESLDRALELAGRELHQEHLRAIYLMESHESQSQ